MVTHNLISNIFKKIEHCRWSIVGAFSIVVLSSTLYLPFLSNALVFDDHNLFTNLAVYDHAQAQFDFHPRSFPYFTLGLVQVLFGTIEAQRLVSLFLHVLCALMIFALLSALLKQALQLPKTPDDTPNKLADNQASTLAFVAASWFAIHPVAVYGAGYLVQRTILFATLFSLLSLWFYRRAFAENRTADIFTAALFYSAAVFSKEHAVMLPLAAVALTSLYGGILSNHFKRIGLYLLLCMPAAIAVILASKNAVATSYEPYVSQVIQQVDGIDLLKKSWGPWFVSAVLQSAEFFDYLRYWSIPDIRGISVDIRVDFAEAWHSWLLIPKTLFFLLCPLIALFCLKHGRQTALFGCGLLYCWFLYMTELTSVRFQEPFVLYRSYLWAPGFAMMLVALLSYLRWKYSLISFLFLLPLYMALSYDRLTSLESEYTVWQDAATKLAAPNLPGADRIYYNRGGEYFKLNQLDAALEDLNRVVALSPSGFHGYLGRGIIYLKNREYQRALTEFDMSLSIKPELGFALYRRGVALEGLGRRNEALEAYSIAMKAGDANAKARLAFLTKASQQ